MTPPNLTKGSERLERESLRVLRRLCEAQAVLAVARDMDMAVVVRESPDGTAQRTAVVERDIAQAMALQEWISCTDPQARVARYRITQLGRQELRRLSGDDPGMAEARAQFVGARGTEESDDRIRHMRSILGESPLAALARRRDKDGQPFLSREMVAAGERLREDFELAQMGGRVTQDWARFLTGPAQAVGPGDQRDRGAAAARQRVADALADLGPGLGDVALRCCCYQEGLETLERNMGWAARSGKVVLRIAMQRLQRHYAETGGKFGPMIG
jgi:DNA-binding PadR family transcriptional regulator